MTTILLTGFGPFPGAPCNPTGALVRELARRCDHFPGVRRIAHVFVTGYRAVDQELPALVARERPDALIMFGLAARARTIRVERRARNWVAGLRDAAGDVPSAGPIATDAPADASLCAAAPLLAAAVRATGLPTALSVDAGSYLCNYVSWRAAEIAKREALPRLVAFIHVPPVHGAMLPAHSKRRGAKRRARARPPTFADLINAGEAILRAALPAARVRH